MPSQRAAKAMHSGSTIDLAQAVTPRHPAGANVGNFHHIVDPAMQIHQEEWVGTVCNRVEAKGAEQPGPPCPAPP